MASLIELYAHLDAQETFSDTQDSIQLFAGSDPTVFLDEWMAWRDACSVTGMQLPTAGFKRLLH